MLMSSKHKLYQLFVERECVWSFPRNTSALLTKSQANGLFAWWNFTNDVTCIITDVWRILCSASGLFYQRKSACNRFDKLKTSWGKRGLVTGAKRPGRFTPCHRGRFAPDRGCAGTGTASHSSREKTLDYKLESWVKRVFYAGRFQLSNKIHDVSVVTQIKGRSELHQKA